MYKILKSNKKTLPGHVASAQRDTKRKAVSGDHDPLTGKRSGVGARIADSVYYSPPNGGFWGEISPQIPAKPSVPPQIGTPKFWAGRILED